MDYIFYSVLCVCITLVVLSLIQKPKPEIRALESADLHEDDALIFSLPESSIPYTQEKLELLQQNIKNVLSKNGIENKVFVIEPRCKLQIIKRK